VMRDGFVEQIGSPLDLYDRPANLFVAGFIGSPAMNFLDAQAQPGEGGMTLRVGDTVLAVLPGQRLPEKVIVGIRPERAALSPNGNVPARVDLVEPTGLGTVAHLEIGGQGLKLFTTDRPALKAGEIVRLAIAPGDLRLFDPASGERIRLA